MFSKNGWFVYVGMSSMNEVCSKCGLKFELEPGFWLGALWTSYPIVVILELPFLIYAANSADSNLATVFSLMVLVFILFYPVMIRVGRSIWISIWVKRENRIS